MSGLEPGVKDSFDTTLYKSVYIHTTMYAHVTQHISYFKIKTKIYGLAHGDVGF